MWLAVIEMAACGRSITSCPSGWGNTYLPAPSGTDPWGVSATRSIAQNYPED